MGELLRECFADRLMQASKRRVVAKFAQAGDVSLGKVLVASREVGGKWDVLDFSRAMHLKQSFRYCFESGRGTGACVDYAFVYSGR